MKGTKDVTYRIPVHIEDTDHLDVSIVLPDPPPASAKTDGAAPDEGLRPK